LRKNKESVERPRVSRPKTVSLYNIFRVFVTHFLGIDWSKESTLQVIRVTSLKSSGVTGFFFAFFKLF